MEKGLLIKAEQLNGKMATFLLYKNIFFKNSFLIYNTKCCIVSVSWTDLTMRYVYRQKTYHNTIRFLWIVAALKDNWPFKLEIVHTCMHTARLRFDFKKFRILEMLNFHPCKYFNRDNAIFWKNCLFVVTQLSEPTHSKCQLPKIFYGCFGECFKF